MAIKSPYPYFGGKSKIAKTVWQWFGDDIKNYIEQFVGSNAMLLARPNVNYDKLPKETINDKDGFVSNFWRCLAFGKAGDVARHADWPVNENDLHARHIWLVNQVSDFVPRLEADPEFCDSKIAGYWVWGMAAWIGSGFCSGNGPWRNVEGQLIHVGNNGQGIKRKLIHVGSYGQGINRQRIHVGNRGTGQGVNSHSVDIYDYMQALADRMRRVRVCSGDWKRVTGKSVTWTHGHTAVFLDPPYADTAKRQSDLYRIDCEKIAHDVREWAISEGHNPLMRIALCGYEGEHDMPDDWHALEWKAGKGFAGQNKKENNENQHKERIWFSPHCVNPDKSEKQMSLL